jgi:hypothetical protein
MDRGIAQRLDPAAQAARQLGVDEEGPAHAARITGWATAREA